MAKSMYDIIKKQNGEHFAKAIRNYDNGIFDVPNIDKIVKYAGRDAEPIMNYLVSLKNIQIEEHAVHQDPIKLLDMAGYDAYIADTLKKQNAIKKYYARGEELCTFRDPDMFKNYHIINAVRKDVDKIKRGKTPQRDDEYGTSVISIQILKTGGFISIKNRYNHTVKNCDNTLNSNPDNIILGLADAIKHHFDVDFSSQQVPLYGNYTLIDKQIYHYKGELNNVYWSENSYVKDGHIVEIDKGSQIMLGDGLLLDLKQKEARNLTGWRKDDFVESLNAAIKNKKLQIAKNPLGGHDVIADNKQILTVENAEIVNINIPDAHTIEIHSDQLRGDLDFSGVTDMLDLNGTDLSRVTSIKFPQKIKSMYLEDATLPACDLDVSGVTDTLDLTSADLSHVKSIKFPQKTQYIYLGEAKLPACDLDVSGTNYLYVNYNDLSNVKSIKFPPKMEFLSRTDHSIHYDNVGYSDVPKLLLSYLKYAFKHGKQKILQSAQQKLKNIGTIQNAKNQNDFE
ncbi:MAG: hypothetical protein J6R99_03120 [Alphaproteobacteria bacterium]|nr:hypothetical protein [Alphaproteobacteria bacterium]